MDYILERAYAVAHLPADKIAAGFDNVTAKIDAIDPQRISAQNMAKLQEFSAYLRRFWKKIPQILSVFQNPVKTNNTCENFHMIAARAIGKHRTLWRMLGKYAKINTKTKQLK